MSCSRRCIDDNDAPAPGEVLREWFPNDMSVEQAADASQIVHGTFVKVLKGDAGVMSEIAGKLAV